MAATQPVRVIYVAGYGRSGSTILDIALGQHPDVFGAGEITALTRHVWEQNEYCACGQPVQHCQFWPAVMQQWLRRRPESALGDYAASQEKFESLSGLARSMAGVGQGSQFAIYARQTRLLFDEVLSRSGKRAIVDSSKLPGRAMALAHIPDIDLRIVHLVRDGRGVAWSLAKAYGRDAKSGLQREIKPKSASRTALRWTTVNLATEYLAGKLGRDRVLRVRYEDFASDPAETLREIGSFAGLDLGETGERLKRGDPVRPSHQIAGNRLRMSTAISVAKDEAWRSMMPRGQQAAFHRLGGWMLRRYGYC